MFSGIQYKEKEKWWQVVIADESALSGESLIRLLQLVSQHIAAQFVALDDIEGAGEGINGLVSDDCRVLQAHFRQLLTDADYARKISHAGRAAAISHFGKDAVRDKWRVFFEDLARVQ